MASYVLLYSGGSGMPETAAEQEAVMASWGVWYGALGESLVDGGNPFGPARTVAPDGAATDGGVSGLTGYTIISAASLDAAVDAAKGCPVLSSGGSVEVYETFEVM